MTCTVIGLVVACSGAPVQTPAQALAMMKQHAAEIVDVQIAARPEGLTRPDTAAEALALMRQHQTKISNFEMLESPVRTARPDLPFFQKPRQRFGESPWWWSELYDPWWYEPWVAKPWQLEPRPEPCCGR